MEDIASVFRHSLLLSSKDYMLEVLGEPDEVLYIRSKLINLRVTEVAFRFAQEQQGSSHVFSLRANQTQSFRHDIDEILRQCSPNITLSPPLEAKIRELQELLEDPEMKKWFLVIKKGESKAVPGLSDLLPKSPNGRVLVILPDSDSESTEPLASLDNTCQIGPTQHVVFSTSEELPFETLRHIGAGGAGMIREVRIRGSIGPFARPGETYVLKEIRFLPRKNRGSLSPSSIGEIEIVKHLRHVHITRIIFSYEVSGTTLGTLGILMDPVADGDLLQYFDLHPQPRLRAKWLGCLASATAYIHSRGIRHGDIKPSNILVKKGEIFLSDFGISTQSKPDGNDTIHFIPQDRISVTPKYAPPELDLRHRAYNSNHFVPWNSSADIFQLGCVFTEIVTIIFGQDREKSLCRTSGYGDSLEENLRWLVFLARLAMATRTKLPVALFAWIFGMLQPDWQTRIDSTTLHQRFIASKEWQALEEAQCSCFHRNSASPCTADSEDEEFSERIWNKSGATVTFPDIPIWKAVDASFPISWDIANREWVAPGRTPQT